MSWHQNPGLWASLGGLLLVALLLSNQSPTDDLPGLVIFGSAWVLTRVAGRARP